MAPVARIESGTLVGLMPVGVRAILAALLLERPATCGGDRVRTHASIHPSADDLCRPDCSRDSVRAIRSALSADRPKVEAQLTRARHRPTALQPVTHSRLTPTIRPTPLRFGAASGMPQSLLDALLARSL